MNVRKIMPKIPNKTTSLAFMFSFKIFDKKYPYPIIENNIIR
tara:strand:- start:567 stop:692 length:126 start_codon:yes stop_codon:yes gene_type:complete